MGFTEKRKWKSSEKDQKENLKVMLEKEIYKEKAIKHAHIARHSLINRISRNKVEWRELHSWKTKLC